MGNFSCAAPWRGLHINIRGDVKTCCAGNPNMLGNINDKGIEEILNGPELGEIREQIRQGVAHPYCFNCVNREKANADSERVWHNKINEDFDITKAGECYEYPTLIDVRWNSTCNLSCNYCGPKESSKWASLVNNNKLAPMLKLSNISNTRHYYTDVCDFILKHKDKVKEVALIGGEPLLLPENERLLDVIAEDCVVTVITNLSNTLEGNKVFEKLKQRKRVGWSISFDNIGERFEYVRYGAKWQMMLDNLKTVKELMATQGHWGGIHAVYSLYNATALCEFKNFAREQNLSIKWQNLSVPEELDPRRYGAEIAKLAAQEIESMFATCQVTDEERSLFFHALDIYKQKMENNKSEIHKLKEFVEKIETYHPDKKGDFARLWPNFGELINGS